MRSWSDIAIDVIVKDQDKEAAVRAVHEAFLKDGEQAEAFARTAGMADPQMTDG